MTVAIIPARGGSKRIPRKNIAPLLGRTLLDYTLDAALGALERASVFVSTDDDEIAAVAQAAGVGVVRRPPQIATDAASTESALLHALAQPALARLAPSWVLTLPPTSPLRDAAVVSDFMRRADVGREDVDCYFSVTENRGDFWRLQGDGAWTRLFPDAPRRQQDREPLYEENSAIYLTRRAALSETGSILGRKAVGIPIPREAAVDVNDALDLDLAGHLLSRRRAVP